MAKKHRSVFWSVARSLDGFDDETLTKKALGGLSPRVRRTSLLYRFVPKKPRKKRANNRSFRCEKGKFYFAFSVARRYIFRRLTRKISTKPRRQLSCREKISDLDGS